MEAITSIYWIIANKTKFQEIFGIKIFVNDYTDEIKINNFLDGKIFVSQYM